jgi:L-lactate dehydrogenase complex protein LldE
MDYSLHLCLVNHHHQRGNMSAAFSKPAKVYFFGTCLMDVMYPEAGLAAIKLIQREGVKVVFPPDQTCCGQPAYNSGYPEEAKAVARQQLKCFTQDYPIVVPSGSCAGMMKHHYPELFADAPDLDNIKHFAGRVYELSEFLTRHLDVQLEDQGQPIKVTWHTSCSALREMQVVEESKNLLRQLKNVELVRLPREEECCGFGGTFAVKQPHISGAMVKDKVNNIQSTGASRVIAGDCGCLMNITGALQQRRIPITGQHFAEFIWERTNG